MHRSGTSALARILNLMGAHFGDGNIGLGANPENPKGFWERRDVRSLNDTVLFNQGCDWDCVSDFRPDRVAGEMAQTYQSAAFDIVLGLDAHRPWFVKDPRLCLTFPVWRPVLELPLCIHIHRNPLAVARSLERRNGMPIEVGLALWEAYSRHALAGAAGLPTVHVSYERLLDDPMAAIVPVQKAAAEHGYRLRIPMRSELGAFVQAAGHQESVQSFRAVASGSQVALYEQLLAAPERTERRELADESVATLKKYEAASVDVSQRIAAANRHKEDDVHLKVANALKAAQLSHAKATEQDVRQRLQKVERIRDEALATSHRLDKELALARKTIGPLEDQVRSYKERNAQTAERIAELEQSRKALQQANADLMRDRDRLARQNEQRRRDQEAAEERLTRHSRDHTRLVASHRALERRHRDLGADHLRLKGSVQALRQGWRRLRRRQEALRLEHELLRSDWQELADFANELTRGFSALVGTWRWRIGHGLLSLPRRLSLRGGRPMVTDAMRLLIESHGERRAEFAERRNALDKRLARRGDDDLVRLDSLWDEGRSPSESSVADAPELAVRDSPPQEGDGSGEQAESGLGEQGADGDSAEQAEANEATGAGRRCGGPGRTSARAGSAEDRAGNGWSGVAQRKASPPAQPLQTTPCSRMAIETLCI